MSDRPPDDVRDGLPDDVTEPIGDEGPGSDPGAGYDRAAEAGQRLDDERERAEPALGVEDVYRSGS